MARMIVMAATLLRDSVAAMIAIVIVATLLIVLSDLSQPHLAWVAIAAIVATVIELKTDYIIYSTIVPADAPCQAEAEDSE